MKLLCFQAKRFWWRPFSKTLPEAPDLTEPSSAEACVVAFVHLEQKDEPEAERKRVFTRTLKHLKWLANKRDLKAIVLHSFTHLGGDTADAGFAEGFLGELAERLAGTGYDVQITPFGYFCEWSIDVYGESLAKVWKEI